MKKNIKNAFLILLLSTAIIQTSCKKDEPVIEAPIAAFSYSLNPDNNLDATFTNTSIGATSYLWDFGDGNVSTDASPSYLYATSGTYTVTLTATNDGGSDDISEDITVSGFGPNLVVNGDMETEEGWVLTQLWTAADNLMKHRYNNGVFLFESGDDGAGNVYRWSQYLLYQGVPVTAGSTYHLSADVSAAAGTSNTWFEIYLTKNAPTSEADVDPNGTPAVPYQFGLKSFGAGEDCILNAFDGDIMTIAGGCTGVNSFNQLISAEGVFTPTADNISDTGMIYFVIKTGNWDGTFNDGMTLDNVVIKEAL